MFGKKAAEALDASKELGEVMNALGYSPTTIWDVAEQTSIQATIAERQGKDWDEAKIEAVHDALNQAVAGAGAL